MAFYYYFFLILSPIWAEFPGLYSRSLLVVHFKHSSGYIGWPHTAWLSFIESDKAVVHVIRLARCLCQSVCPLMPSLSSYCLTSVSLTLDMGYLFTAAPAKCSHCSLAWTWGSSSQLSLYCRAAVMVERSDRMWSTGEGNGKPLQSSCLENPMNSMKRQKYRTLNDDSPGC